MLNRKKMYDLSKIMNCEYHCPTEIRPDLFFTNPLTNSRFRQFLENEQNLNFDIKTVKKPSI